MSKLFTTTLRINLTKPEGRKAWAYLKNRDKSRYCSYSDAIIAAVNGYFDREKQLADDPYLETLGEGRRLPSARVGNGEAGCTGQLIVWPRGSAASSTSPGTGQHGSRA